MSFCRSIGLKLWRTTLFFVTVALLLPLFTSCKQEALATDSNNNSSHTVSDTVFLSQLPCPDVSARSALLMDASSGAILASKNVDERLPMASTTKIMTALVAADCSDLSTPVEIPQEVVGIEGSSIYLYAGERLTLEDLLYAMLLESANDAAAAIAVTVGGSIEGFADMMNEKAAELGLENTHFTNPHGLDHEEHYTTARELALITRAALENETVANIVSTYKKTIPLNETEGVRLLINHNKLLKSYDGTVGVKTGYTKKSGRCLVSAAERDGLKLICVTLSAPDDWQDHKALLDYGFSSYESRTLLRDGELELTLPVIGGDKEYVTLKNRGEIRVTLPRNAEGLVRTVELPSFAYAPVAEGEILGKVIFTLNGKTVAETPLAASYPSDRIVYKRSLWDRITSLFNK